MLHELTLVSFATNCIIIYLITNDINAHITLIGHCDGQVERDNM